MSEKLLPCPFCRNNKTVKTYSTTELFEHKAGDDVQYTTVCPHDADGCGSSGRYELTPEKAEEAWNTRPDSKPYKHLTFDEWCEYSGFSPMDAISELIFNAARERKE